MVTGAGFATVPVPVADTVTVNVCAAAFAVEDEEPPPQAMSKPAREIVSAVSNTAIARLRRKPNGAPSSAAHNISAPPLFHPAGSCFAALVVAEIVSVLVPLPLLVKVTDGAEAPTNEGNELVALKLTVPA
jgi:hypothetical protein